MTLAPTLDLPIHDVRHDESALIRDWIDRPGVVEHGH
jgi:hypothetical protein